MKNTSKKKPLSQTPSYTQQLYLSFSIYGKDWAFYPRIGLASTTHIIERITALVVNPTPDAIGAYQTTYDNLASSSYNTFNRQDYYTVNTRNFSMSISYNFTKVGGNKPVKTI